jgi:hypothetical protein
MDQLYPMMYFRDNQFFPFLLDWQERSYGRTVAAGLGIYFLDPREGRWQLSDVTRQLEVMRQEGLGQCFFRSKFLTDNHKGIYDYVCQHNRQPALVPPMTWAGQTAPKAPTGLYLQKQTLWWRGAQSTNDSPYLLYNIYASNEYPVDTSKPENLVATRIRTEQLQVLAGKYYAVCAVDRYGQESQPRQLAGVSTRRSTSAHIVRTNGKWLDMPVKDKALDAEYVIIETLQGQKVKALPYPGKQLDIRKLPDGVYVLKSLGRKGVTHRLTHFSIKRNH